VWLIVFFSSMSVPAWGYYFDDRREMSLSGFAYSRATFATQDGISAQKHLYEVGNLVQHRNFLTLEWRHNINRAAREFPTLGALAQFLNFDAFTYYLNLRVEYDGVYDYGPMKQRRLMRGERRHLPYFDDPTTPTPFDGTYFTPGAAAFFPADTISLSDRRHLRELRGARVRLFEWYFNLTKGPLFIRIGRQNLSWGETDGFRLLDQINPLDNLFGGFLTSLDERRVPLNMLRAQWNFGAVGPIQDLTLEGFYSIDNETNPVLPSESTFFWNEPEPGAVPIMQGRTPCGGDFMAKRGIPPLPLLGYGGSGPGPNHGGGCSIRGDGPHASLEDGRGGGRLLGNIADFTWSIAHYYTYQDLPQIRATIISPTPLHLAWDLGALPPGAPNPWGPNDPVAQRMISSGANPAGQGGIASLAGAERNLRSTVNFQRIQITGGSLSFPLSALSGLFVGPESPLFYSYTTIRAEVAYFNNVPTTQKFTHFDGGVAIARFLRQGPFAPDGPLARQGGKRTAHLIKRDWLAWNIGVDHNQWIRWLNPYYTFTLSAQLFWTNRNGQKTDFDSRQPPGVLNDKDGIAAGRRETLRLPLAAPASFFDFPGQDILTTFAMNTQYLGGNMQPSLTFFYDWAGAWLLQPGLDWKFWDPWRLSLRYNWLDGRGNIIPIGAFNRKDNVWVELQYALY
jgi:hypothetical protein